MHHSLCALASLVFSPTKQPPPVPLFPILSHVKLPLYFTTQRCPNAPCLTAFCFPLQEEKQKIQNDLRILTERLSRINDSLARKVASRNEYDKTIMETEAAYMKILESSQVQLPTLPLLPPRAAFALAFNPSTGMPTFIQIQVLISATYAIQFLCHAPPPLFFCKRITLGFFSISLI